MPNILTETVAAGATGTWAATDGATNIAVGVTGNKYRIEYNFGDLATPHKHSEDNGAVSSIKEVIIAKANEVRVVSTGPEPVIVEVFI